MDRQKLEEAKKDLENRCASEDEAWRCSDSESQCDTCCLRVAIECIDKALSQP